MWRMFIVTNGIAFIVYSYIHVFTFNQEYLGGEHSGIYKYIYIYLYMFVYIYMPIYFRDLY